MKRIFVMLQFLVFYNLLNFYSFLIATDTISIVSSYIFSFDRITSSNQFPIIQYSFVLVSVNTKYNIVVLFMVFDYEKFKTILLKFF